MFRFSSVIFKNSKTKIPQKIITFALIKIMLIKVLQCSQYDVMKNTIHLI